MRKTPLRIYCLAIACAAFVAQVFAPAFARGVAVSDEDTRSLLCLEAGDLTKAAETAARELLGGAHRDNASDGYCLLCHAPAAFAPGAPNLTPRGLRLVSHDVPLPDETTTLPIVAGPPLGLRAPPQV